MATRSEYYVFVTTATMLDDCIKLLELWEGLHCREDRSSHWADLPDRVKEKLVKGMALRRDQALGIRRRPSA